MVLLKLAISNFLARKTRVALTVAAVALSVSLVVSVTSGYSSVLAAAHKYLNFYLGSIDANIVRRTDPKVGIPDSLLVELTEDPSVRRAWGRLETEAAILPDTPATGSTTQPTTDPISGLARRATVFGVDPRMDDALGRMQLLEGKWFGGDSGDYAVVDQGARDRYQLKLGDWITLPGPDTRARLKVIGVVRKPGIFVAHIQSLYMPLRTLQRFADMDGKLSRISVEFQPNTDSAAWKQRWEARLDEIDPLLRLRLARETREQLDTNLEGVRILSYLGGAVSMLAATFIVFSSLSMGVAERQRTLAMLHAIGALRHQVGGLVVLEGLILSGLGVLVGVPLGWFWVYLLGLRFSDLFGAGIVLDGPGVALASAGSVAAAVAASLIPAWTAMRVDPLEAMTPLAKTAGRAAPVGWALLGLLLIGVDAFILFAPYPQWLGGAVLQYEREVRFYTHFIIGLGTLMLGFFLLAPMFVWLLEHLAGPVVAWALGLRFALLRQQLSSGIWRAAGTCAALMVGLAVLVVMQTQGNSALKSWRLPDRFPDVFIWSQSFAGLSPDDQQAIAARPGIKPGSTMPIVMFSPQFGTGVLSLAGAAVMPDATMFFGIDPDRAFQIMELDFRMGNAEDAAAMLKKGRHLIITDELRQLKGYKIGDKFALKSPFHKEPVEYTIAGSVWSPGLDVMVATFDLGRQFEQRTASSVFGTLEDAKRDFGVENVYLMAADLQPGIEKEQVREDLTKSLGDKGFQVADVRQLKHNIQKGFGRLLLVASTVAWAAMAVASLGVTNTVMASIRSRRWQFGILRSIGVTQSMLLRMVLAEAVLIGIVGSLLGLAAGMVMSMNARRLSRLLIGFDPPLSVPWDVILGGAAVVMAVSVLASLIPAIRVARTEPLALLQAGRAAT